MGTSAIALLDLDDQEGKITLQRLSLISQIKTYVPDKPKITDTPQIAVYAVSCQHECVYPCFPLPRIITRTSQTTTLADLINLAENNPTAVQTQTGQEDAP